VVIISFEELIKCPAAFLRRVADDLKLVRIEWSDATAALMEGVVRRADEQFRVDQYDRNSLPNGEKNQRKAEIAKRELSTQAKARLERCTKLRSQILERAVQVI
jgi:hypothetical protein